MIDHFAPVMSLPDVDSLTLEEKVGQLFAIGFHETTVPDDVESLITERHVGNVIYFSRNIESPTQVAELSNDLQDIALEDGPGIPMLVSTDQEGGVVSRLDWGTELPGNMMLGAAGDPELARRAGAAVGAELAAIGINFDLAPVLDVNNNPENPVIGVRSFGEDPELVGELGAAFAEGMQSEGVIACGKHFPGHGDTSADSHHELPVVGHDRERLDRVEFAPFRRAIESGIDSIMTTHVSFPEITGESGTPATVSRAVQTELLREELGFEGLVVTDCLEMSAIADDMGTPEGAVQAIEAGCDLALVSHTAEKQSAAVEAAIDAVESGRIDEGQIDASVERVLAYKRKRIVNADPAANDRWEATAERSRETGREIARAGITVVRDRDDTLPFDADRPLHLVGFLGGRASPAEDDRYDPEIVGDALAEHGFDVRTHSVEGAEGIPTFEPGEQVLAAVYNAMANEPQAEAVAELDERDLSFVPVAIRNPYDLSRFPGVSTFVTTYDYTPGTLTALGEILAGEREARGTLPVTVPGVE